MRRFLGSAWFPFLICLVFAGASVGAYAVLKPTGDAVGNYEIVRAMKIAGWVTGPVAGILSFLGIGILNIFRRIVRARKVPLLHPVIVLLGVLPWFVFSWQLTGEPPYTPFARGAIEFIGRPLLWGSLAATLLTVLLSIPLLLRAQK